MESLHGMKPKYATRISAFVQSDPFKKLNSILNHSYLKDTLLNLKKEYLAATSLNIYDMSPHFKFIDENQNMLVHQELIDFEHFNESRSFYDYAIGVFNYLDEFLVANK